MSRRAAVACTISCIQRLISHAIIQIEDKINTEIVKSIFNRSPQTNTIKTKIKVGLSMTINNNR